MKRYQVYSITELEKLTALYMHEFGHYLDSDKENLKKHTISTSSEVVNIFKEELENLKYCTTSIEQNSMSHVIGKSYMDSESEIVADTNALLHTEEPTNAARLALFMQHFPRTIAKIAEILEEEESKFLAQ